MRVGIDVSILSSPLTGIGRFILPLVQALARLPDSTQWVLLGAPEQSCELPEGENVVVHRSQGLRGARRVAWQQVMLPRLALVYAVDVLHCPDFSRPVSVSVPVVNTIHDLSFYSSRAFVSLPRRIYKRRLTRIAVRKSTRIVTDSTFTRDELVHRFRLDDSRTAVIYLGARDDPFGDPFLRQDEVRAPPSGDHRSPLQTESPFVLFVGTLEERKNVRTLIRGFALMRSQDCIPHRLILAGKPGRGFKKIQAAIHSLSYAQDIEVLGYVSGENLLQLYRSAEVVVMPSLYEGFGIPVLEAMALGAPVVCSRAASLPEVGGDAVEYFDPLSPQELAAALSKVLRSESLRSDMRRKGLERAKLFTWDECARRYCEVYREAAAPAIS